MAEAFAALISDDLEVPILTVDVLDWLASSGLTLRPDQCDATVVNNLALDDLDP
ncbi:MAG: hypothetical protein JJE52_16395 [Acidimicrobiia bacterium]|nr:hypothetical protein [Acidimicrobiia bacterium]